MWSGRILLFVVSVYLLFVSVSVGAAPNNGNTLVDGEKKPAPPPPRPSFPVGDPRRCTVDTKDPMYRFEVLPGGGWDNLRNRDMGQIVAYNYSQCLATNDGRYLLPDGVYTIPRKSSKVETYAELFEHWHNYTSTLSRSINVHAGLNLKHVSISGKFSDEYESVKSRQHFDKAVTTRIQARYLQYTSKLEPDTPLTEPFRKRLYKIAAHLVWNRTDLARYESQLLVRDFGTHVVTSIDVGAALVQVDHLSEDYLKKLASQKHSVLASASASFFGIFDFGADYSTKTAKEEVETYKKQRTSSHVLTYGGPVFRPRNFTANDWGAALANDLVALDRSGDPIYYLITEAALPGMSTTTVLDVQELVKQAVHVYYSHNTYRGCTKEDSPNFSFASNVDDGSCKPVKTNYTFGGVYQTCTNRGHDNLCSGMTQKNPQTGKTTCPDGYEPVPLNDGHKSSSRSERHCHGCWLFFKCCDTVHYSSSAHYTAYWCAATGRVPANSGFLFGGLFTSTVSNIMTQSRSCPLHYYPLKLLKDLTVCVSDDYELGYQYSLPFAGFFSCNSGNPLALKEKNDLLKSKGNSGVSMLANFMKESGISSYPKTCPDGYSQHLAVVDDGCELNFCVKTGALTPQGLPTVNRPPFMEAPRDGFTLLEESEVVSHDGTVWTNIEDAKSEINSYLLRNGLPSYTDGNKVVQPTYDGDKSHMSSGEGLSGGSIAAITVCATLACIIVATIIVLQIRRRRVRYREADPWSENRPITGVATRTSYGDQSLPSEVTRT